MRLLRHCANDVLHLSTNSQFRHFHFSAPSFGAESIVPLNIFDFSKMQIYANLVEVRKC